MEFRLKHGEALIGVCQENYLAQARNKREYVTTSGCNLSFGALAQQVSERMFCWLNPT